MNDIRRTFLWIAFGMSMILLWDQWQLYQGKDRTFFPQPAATSTSKATPSKDGAPVNQDASANTLPTASADLQTNTIPTSLNPKQSLVEMSTDVFKLSFDLEGGSLVRAELLKHRDLVDKNRQMVLLDQSKDRLYNVQSGLIGGENFPNHKTPMTLVTTERELDKDAHTLVVTFEGVSGNIKLLKTYTFKRGSYAIDVTHEITNNSATDIKPQLYTRLVRDGNKPDGESAFYSTFTGPVVYSNAKKYQKIEFSEVEKNKATFEKYANDGYVGIVQHYFFSAWLAPANGTTHENFVRKIDSNLYDAGMLFAIQPVAPGQSQTHTAQLYVGPQEEKNLEALAPGLELVKDYGYFTIFSKPLFWIIDKLHDLLGNWGWAIVAVVVILKMAFYWLNAMAYRSMAKMKAANPKIMEMRERLKDKPQQMQQEMMRIYKEEKINPLGGCLPMLVQIPVFIALYWVLLSSVEFRDAPWILWIKDLSAPDPFFILPLLMTASSLFQTWLNPTPPDPMQAKLMWIMPLVFSVMFIFFPAGLVLYWLINNLLSIAQQWVINKQLGVS